MCKDCAYIQHNVSEKTQQKLNIYFKQLQQVDDLLQVHDQICKVTLTTTQDNNQQILDDLSEKPYIQHTAAKMVSSGFGLSILLFQTDIKAYGLQFLQQKWGIDHQEVLAIGDNYNDQEMIEMADMVLLWRMLYQNSNKPHNILPQLTSSKVY
jgi:sugar-phosphatase